MSEYDEFKRRLEVWSRIQNGTASPRDHALAMTWGEEHYANSLKNARPLEKWMMTTGKSIMEAWPFPMEDAPADGFSREQILLFELLYGKSDIENGGFEQFFGNDTGNFANELALGLESIQLFDLSQLIREGMALFGDDYLCGREHRTALLPKLHDELGRLSNDFFSLLPAGDELDEKCAPLLKAAET